MKKRIGLMNGVLVAAVFLLVSCGGAPVKEMDEAKAALEKAKQADAKVYAVQEYKEAEDDFLMAVTYTNQNQNGDAKDKALSSKVKAEASYQLSIQNRAKVTFDNNNSLISQAKSVFADKIKSAEYAAAISNNMKVGKLIDQSNFTAAYDQGAPIGNSLKSIIAECRKLLDGAKVSLENVQSRYAWAEKSEIVKKYAMADLEQAKPLIADSASSLSAGDPKLSSDKSYEADKIITAALDKANAAYKKSLEKPVVKPQPDPDQQTDEELDKKKAEDEMKKANEALEKIKKDKEKKGSFLDNNTHTFTLSYSGIIYLGQAMPQIDSSQLIPETNKNNGLTAAEKEAMMPKEVPDEEVTVELVEKYYALAQDAYDKGEYLDAVDFAREAMRLAEILLNKQEGATYTVVLNVKDRDCLWKIAAKMYENNAWMWPIIWKANTDQIKDPDLIYPDQVFKIPPSLIK
ncbi:MAG: LysM peptidoglycan-binding domain-containing protein [Brevinematales bacterium]|nr:LysM peptidoglycan-binding domain-containing protein [Brevinematales bacterium]